MKRIYITGMSGTGKSSVIRELAARGFDAIDTDDGWTELRDNGDGPEWLLREDRLRALLESPLQGPLFVSGCCSNQGRFYRYFDRKILLSAPLEVMRERIRKRPDNPYGKSEEDWAQICENYEYVQPLLQQGTDSVIHTAKMDIEEVADYLSQLALR